jgi:RNA polymerase sigma-70 factor (ECF subfamily)
MKLLEYYGKFENEIISFSKSLSKNDWEDFIQHAWIKAIGQKYVFESMNYYQARSWFYKVIRNRFYDSKRKNKNIILTDGSILEFSSADNVNQFILKDSVLSFLDMLDETDQKIVLLKYYSGKNSTEIGSELGINPSTVRYRLKKSLNIIKTKITRSDYYE